MGLTRGDTKLKNHIWHSAFAAALAFCFGHPAHAENLLLFGATGTPDSAYWYTGAILPIGGGLGDEGFKARLWAAGVYFDYETGGPQGEVSALGPDLEASVGYLVHLGDTTVSVYGGLRARYLELDPDDPGSDIEDEHLGVSGQLQIEHAFNEMLGFNLIGNYTSNLDVFWSRLRPYWKADTLLFGPELIFSGGSEYDNNRFGGYLAGIPVGPLRMEVNAGGERERGGDLDPYGGISFSFLF